MKKISLLFIVSVVMLLSINILAAQDCPPGYSVGIDTITINNCQYSVTFCYLCNGKTNPSDLVIHEFHKINPNCFQQLDMNRVYMAICEQLKANEYLQQKLVVCLVPVVLDQAFIINFLLKCAGRKF